MARLRDFVNESVDGSEELRAATARSGAGRRVSVHAAVAGALLFAGSGCSGADGEADDSRWDHAVPAAGVLSVAVVNDWTPFTSEEYPPIVCDGSSIVAGVKCEGYRCDNISAYCKPTAGVRGGSYYTQYFSEEGHNWSLCAAGEWMTGLSCSGLLCDNVSVQCTKFNNLGTSSCHWSGWVSEEHGGRLIFGPGERARGVECSGSYCGSKRFYVCTPTL